MSCAVRHDARRAADSEVRSFQQERDTLRSRSAAPKWALSKEMLPAIGTMWRTNNAGGFAGRRLVFSGSSAQRLIYRTV